MATLPAFVRVRPARGWAWLVQAHGMFAKARLQWLLLVLSYWVLTAVMSVVPVVGVVAATLLKPVFAVGFLAAAWSQERGARPRLAQLFAGFRSNLRALLPLGAFYGVGIALALFVSAVVDGGVLMRWFLLGETPTGNLMALPGVRSAMLVAAIAAVPTLFALWFAPALIVFQDQTSVAALLQSFRAAFANFGAALIYVLSVFLFWIVIPGMIVSVATIMFGEMGFYVGVAISTPLTLSVVSIVFIADYVVYRDLFHHHEDARAA
jgi:hypothetical protein